MKSKLLLLSLSILGFSYANATIDPNPNSGKKEELLGLIQHADNKKPLQRVSITAYQQSQKFKQVVSDENGNYSFTDLKPGIYRFIFEKAGFKSVTREKVVVKTDEGFMMNIEMEEAHSINVGPNALHFSDF